MGEHESSSVPSEPSASIPWTGAPLRIHTPEPPLPLERFPVPALRLNAQGCIQDVNTAGCALLGRTPDALLRHQLASCLTPGSQGSLKHLLTTTTASGQPGQADLHLRTDDDCTVDVRVDASVDPHGVLVVLTDVTAYTSAHQRLLDQLAEQAQEVQAYKARIAALTQDLSGGGLTILRHLDLSVTRAHEFLTVASRAPTTPAGQAEHALQAAERSLSETRAMISAVERYIQARGERVCLQPVKLELVVKQVLARARPAMTGREVRFTHDPLPTVTGDSHVLTAIFRELLDNALKFTRTRDRVSIRLRVQDTPTEYVFGMEDNGVGFNIRHKARLFQLFARLHSPKEFEGTGTGLVSIRWSVERFGGRVWAEGRPNLGATIWFAWPKAPKILA